MSLVTPIVRPVAKALASAVTDNVFISSSDSVSPMTLKAYTAAGPSLQLFNKSVAATYPAFEFKNANMSLGSGGAAVDTPALSRLAAGSIGMGSGLNINSMPSGVSPLVVTGVQPASVATAGVAAQGITITPGKGGNTSGTSGQTAGMGGAITLTGGAGGDAPSGATNAQGGSINLVPGSAGTGAGTASIPGALNIYTNTGSPAIEFGRQTANPGLQQPYIDFHYSAAGTWAAQDYNLRIQNFGDKSLQILTAGQTGNVYLTDGNLELRPNAAVALYPYGFSVKDTMTSSSYAVMNDRIGMFFLGNYQVTTGPAAGTEVPYHGIQSKINIGVAGAPAFGTVEAFDCFMAVNDVNDTASEQGLYVGFLQFNETTRAGAHGRAWLTDLNLHTRVGRPMVGIWGANIFVNKYDSTYPTYSASPTGNSQAVSVVTGPGSGGGGGDGNFGTANHYAATSYPLESGILIVGRSGAPGASVAAGTKGYDRAIMIGANGQNAHGWNVLSKIGVGVWITDWIEYGIHIPSRHANAPAATKSIYVASGAGEAHFEDGLITAVKAGIPTDADTDNDVNGHLIVDGTNNHLYFRSGGTWRRLVPA